MYPVGLVVGKFSPLHKGHELLIKRALTQCEKLIIITYTSENYGYPASVRKHWLETLFPTAIVIAPTENIPDDHAHENVQRDFCAAICESINLIPSAVFTSESYGEGFAKHLSVRWSKLVTHVSVDQARTTVPVSGTMLRQNPDLWNKYTSMIVHRDRVKRVLIIGAESSGKTTISKAISEKLGIPWVHEYGREFGEKTNNVYVFEDLLHIGVTQVELENKALTSGAKVVICDTSPLVTKFYSQAFFGKVDPALEELSLRTYDLVLFCARDFPYDDDNGSRNGIQFGIDQENFYKKYLTQPYTVLEGSVETRLKVAVSAIELLTK